MHPDDLPTLPFDCWLGDPLDTVYIAGSRSEFVGLAAALAWFCVSIESGVLTGDAATRRLPELQAMYQKMEPLAFQFVEEGASVG